MNEQLLQKAKTAQSPEELLALARAEGIELTGEKAAELFQKLTPPAGELSDDELSNVAGGGCGGGGNKGSAFPMGTRVRLSPKMLDRLAKPVSAYGVEYDAARQEVVCIRCNCGNSTFVVTEVREDRYGHIVACAVCGKDHPMQESELIRV